MKVVTKNLKWLTQNFHGPHTTLHNFWGTWMTILFQYSLIRGLIVLVLVSVQYRKINQWKSVPEVWKSLNAILANTLFCSFLEIDCSFKHTISSFSVKHTGNKFTGRIRSSTFTLRLWKKFKPTILCKIL